MKWINWAQGYFFIIVSCNMRSFFASFFSFDTNFYDIRYLTHTHTKHVTIKNCFFACRTWPQRNFCGRLSQKKTKFLHSKMNYKVKLSRFFTTEMFIALFTTVHKWSFTKNAQTIPLIIPPILENSTCLYVILIFCFSFFVSKTCRNQNPQNNVQ